MRPGWLSVRLCVREAALHPRAVPRPAPQRGLHQSLSVTTGAVTVHTEQMSQFWRPEAQNPGAGGAVLPPKAPGRALPALS